jgi:hypothetical protein
MSIWNYGSREANLHVIYAPRALRTWCNNQYYNYNSVVVISESSHLSHTMIPCRYFSRGICRNGDECTYLHENTVGAGGHLRSDALSFPAIDALSINPYTPVPTLSPGLPDYSLNGSSDSRALVLCKFITRPGGCKNGACPYSHNIDKPHSNDPKRLEKDMREEHVNHHVKYLVTMLTTYSGRRH